jgi:hypothetical protein
VSAGYTQNITNTLGTSGTFTIKDGSTNYLTLTQSSGQVNILKSLRLESTIDSTTGIIFKGTSRFLHNYGTGTFLGINAGNFTMIGYDNTAVGPYSLYANTTGYDNTAVGPYSLYANTTGSDNTAVGPYSLYSNTTGYVNTAVGPYSLYANTTGSDNIAVGPLSLQANTTGYDNTAVGLNSLYSNTTGYDNTAVGLNSLYSNTTGYDNTAVGLNSLYSNTTGYDNVALGYGSMYYNNAGIRNIAIGSQSLYYMRPATGTGDNIGLGDYSLRGSTTPANNTGTGNIAIGRESMLSTTSGSRNSAVGFQSFYSITSGSNNSALGYNAGYNLTTGSNNTLIGYNAQPTTGFAVNQVTLGDANITSLRCNVQTISSLSDARDKKNIRELPLGLNFISKLKPREFNWDRREWYEDGITDGSKMKETPTAGFIAQELDEVQTKENAEWLNLVLKDNPEKLEATPGNLLPVMVKAIQELKAENDELKERLTKIEEKLNGNFTTQSTQNK